MRFLRLACSCLKYSDPRLAISLPPFRPRLTAAGSFLFGKILWNRFYVRLVLCTTFAVATKEGRGCHGLPDHKPLMKIVGLRFS